ncbi:type IV pilus modification protein PilV [Isoalcanivorax indicus]|uniref:type IV pilus modification protein PilV n=1 Tax=Isoalcanivorax indicus TaxID=2202653 RepID=UPI000DB96D23|nr:type IV pilus modification protein PilV [Isoalcanivorax indicus]
MLRTRAKQRGFSLMEVLVALLILSIGLLGLAGLQTRGIQMNHSAHLASQANYLGYDILDRMRANREAALAGNYNRRLNDGPPAGDSIAAQDVREWLLVILGDEERAGLLPQEGNGTGAAINVDNDGRTTVTISWLDARWTEDEDERIRTIIIQSQL